MNKTVKKMINTFLVTLSIMYACFILVKQQATFVDYDQEITKYTHLIEEEELRNEQLIATRGEISTDKYIEEIARDKLGLVLPSEIIFIDANS